ncbi:MAG: DUF5063 domain-containing protein [Alphaproteobacteria bacterium]|nr:DUF5063 domain-containing protein [Alphaproteobacteria bacterium]
MDATSLFAELTRDFCSIVLQGAAMSLEDRAVSVDQGLAQLLAAGLALPIVPGEVRPDPASPWDEAAWPGFGSFERYWTVGALAEPSEPLPCLLSQTLQFVFAQLWVGLEAFEAGEPERAAGIWGRGYEDTWGPASTEMLHALHPVVRGYREDARRRVQKRRKGAPGLDLVTPASEPAPVLAEPAMPALPEGEPDRPLLGVRFEPCPGGVAVLAVHPQGPAAGRLDAGDVVLAVDGTSLADLPPDEAGAMLVGAVGEVRRYEVFRRDGDTAMVELAAISMAAFAAVEGG